MAAKKGVRECFVARPGYAIVSVDFDACELRTWAQICFWLFGAGCVLPTILNNPERCPHIELGTRLHDQFVESPEWQEAYAWGYGLRQTDKAKLKDVRGLAKGPGFGLPGGMGWQRLIHYCWASYRVPITPEMAQRACAVWREIYPEAQPYLDWVKDQVGRKYGSRNQIEQFWSKRLRGDTGFTDAANGYFQGLAADIAKRAGFLIAQECYADPKSPLYGCRPLAFVHDEWLVEVPLRKLTEAGFRIAEIMTGTAMGICPDVLFTASPAAMLCWSKAAGDPHFKGPDGKLCKVNTPGRQLITYEEALTLMAA